MISASKVEPQPGVCLGMPNMASLPYSDILCTIKFLIIYLVLDRIIGVQTINMELLPVEFCYGYTPNNLMFSLRSLPHPNLAATGGEDAWIASEK